MAPYPVKIELSEHGDGWRITLRVKVPGKGGAPRRVDIKARYRTQSQATSAAQSLRSACSNAECPIVVKE